MVVINWYLHARRLRTEQRLQNKTPLRSTFLDTRSGVIPDSDHILPYSEYRGDIEYGEPRNPEYSGVPDLNCFLFILSFPRRTACMHRFPDVRGEQEGPENLLLGVFPYFYTVSDWSRISVGVINRTSINPCIYVNQFTHK
jgi:hypothetical protein